MRRQAERFRLVDGIDLAAPDTWHPVPHPVPDGWSAALAADLVQDEDTRLALQLQVGLLAEEISRVEHLAAGVWIPDPSNGVACGAVAVDLVVADAREDLTRDRLREAVRQADRPEIVTHLRTFEDLDLPAGPALLCREIVGAVPNGEVEEHLIFTVFPPGASEALELTFVSSHLELGEQFEEDAAAIAENLQVRLAR